MKHAMNCVVSRPSIYCYSVIHSLIWVTAGCMKSTWDPFYHHGLPLIPVWTSNKSFWVMSGLASFLPLASRVTLHTAELTCTQPTITQHTTGQVADKVAVHERIDSAPKQVHFVHLCVTGIIIVQALFPVIVRHTLGKDNDCKENSKVKNGIRRHASLSKQIGAAVCTASSFVCRSLFWAHLCSVVYSVGGELTGLAPAINLEHDIVR